MSERQRATLGRVLDDLESRPGSATSLLRTVIGSVLRERGGWMPASAFVTLLDAVGVPPDRTRTALSRVKARGLLTAESRDGVAGYALTPAARPMLARGDRRIHHPRAMAEGDPWCLVSFSLPERDRDLRHQLRRRLGWIGCGTVTGALWICPAMLVDEVEEIVADLRLADRVTLFVAEEVRGVTDLRTAVARWWDLAALRRRHDDFLARAGAAGADRPGLTPAESFRAWITVLDAWRPIPYLDPGLPVALLPDDWPGRRSVPMFLHARDRVAAAAGEFARTV